MSKELNIYQKLNNFKSLVGAIRKDKNNPFHKSKYADINSVIEVIAQPLSESGLIDVDTTKKDETGQLYLVTKIVNIDNPSEFLEIETPLLLKDKNNPQALGSSITYNRRYNRVTLLGLEQEDDDANKASEYNQNQRQYQKPAPSTKEKFIAMLLGNGLKKEDFAEFTGFMKGHKGIDLTNESEKMKLIANIPLLKEFIKEFKEYANKQ